jgi:hypothetical protein
MRGVSFRCVMLGHDDRVRWTRGRMYLECAECARETHGWTLSGRSDKPVGSVSPRVPSHRVRWILSLITRRRFHGLGLR